VIDALIQVRNFDRQSLRETAGDLAEEDTRLRTRVKEFYRFVRPDIRAVLIGRHASASVSSIRFATSGGVKTSSLERFAMHVSTSGFRPRKRKTHLRAHAVSFGLTGLRRPTRLSSSAGRSWTA